MLNVSIRPAEPGDVRGIQRVAEDAWNTVYAGVLEQDTIDAALHEWYAHGLVQQQIVDEDVVFFVADDGTSVVGYVSGGLNEQGSGEVGAIYVDPEYWRSGIGSLLLDHFEDHGSEAGWETMQIRVIAENDVARSFYEKHGYEVESTEEAPLFGEPIEEVCYQKSLG